MARVGVRRIGVQFVVASIVAFSLVTGARPNHASAVSPAVAPTNGMIAFFARNGATNAGDKLDLMIMNPDGSSPRATIRGAVAKGGCGFGLDWSPDGNRIAYASDNGVWVVDANGSNNHRISTYCGGSVSWSPTNNWLAVEDINGGTFLIHPNGTGTRFLRTVEHGWYYEFDPAFAADGNTVVESTIGGAIDDGWGVYGFAVSDGHRVDRYISLDTVRPGSIAGSVDVRVAGSATLFDIGDVKSGPDNTCDPLGANGWIDSNIYKLGAPPDATLHRIGNTTSQSALRESDGAWSPDGQSIAFIGNKKLKCNGTSEVQTPPALYTMDANGANVLRVYSAPGDVPLVVDPHWQACRATTKSCTVKTSSCDGLAATIVGTSAADTLIGSNGNDVIAGLGGRDTIKGNGGHDVICGGAGNDSIDGGAGPDTLFGEDNDDTVVGGSGTDVVHGNDGSDSIGGGADPGDHCYGDAGTDALVASAGCESVTSIP